MNEQDTYKINHFRFLLFKFEKKWIKKSVMTEMIKALYNQFSYAIKFSCYFLSPFHPLIPYSSLSIFSRSLHFTSGLHSLQIPSIILYQSHPTSCSPQMALITFLQLINNIQTAFSLVGRHLFRSTFSIYTVYRLRNYDIPK